MKKTLMLTGLLFIILVLDPSCERSKVGYLEVRNHSPVVINDVNWGGILDLGSIPPSEEKGMETELSGEHYIHMNIGIRVFRSEEKISVDARTSATYILEDTANLVSMSSMMKVKD